jgi:hypothetical protein
MPLTTACNRSWCVLATRILVRGRGWRRQAENTYQEKAWERQCTLFCDIYKRGIYEGPGRCEVGRVAIGGPCLHGGVLVNAHVLVEGQESAR